MSIEQKRAEIMRLIARVDARHLSRTRPRLARPASETDRSLRIASTIDSEVAERTERVAARFRELGDLRRRRLSADPSDPKVIERLAQLEERLGKIETLLRGRPASSPQQQRSAKDPLQSVDWTLGGVLQEGLLADMLQLVSSNVMTGVFVVINEDSRIEMFFNEGELFHARGDNDLEGESAFFAAMAFDQGRYCFRETGELPTEHTISNKTQFLILEALRQIDEARAG